VKAHKQGKGYKIISKNFDVLVSSIWSVIGKFKNFPIMTNLKVDGQKSLVPWDLLV
jgi:hypothetical protein